MIRYLTLTDVKRTRSASGKHHVLHLKFEGMPSAASAYAYLIDAPDDALGTWHARVGQQFAVRVKTKLTPDGNAYLQAFLATGFERNHYHADI